MSGGWGRVYSDQRCNKTLVTVGCLPSSYTAFNYYLFNLPRHHLIYLSTYANKLNNDISKDGVWRCILTPPLTSYKAAREYCSTYILYINVPRVADCMTTHLTQIHMRVWRCLRVSPPLHIACHSNNCCLLHSFSVLLVIL